MNHNTSNCSIIPKLLLSWLSITLCCESSLSGLDSRLLIQTNNARLPYSVSMSLSSALTSAYYKYFYFWDQFRNKCCSAGSLVHVFPDHRQLMYINKRSKQQGENHILLLELFFCSINTEGCLFFYMALFHTLFGCFGVIHNISNLILSEKQ